MESETWNTFGHQRVDVKLIYNFLMKFDDDVGNVELFCKLYVVLGISEVQECCHKNTIFCLWKEEVEITTNWLILLI